MTVNPFLNEMLVAEMPGRTLLEALEWGARRAPSASNSTLLHIAGLRYSVATNRPPLRRVGDVTVYDRAEGDWKPLDPSRTYRVAGMDFLLRSGGSGFTVLTNAVPVGFYGGVELDARQFADYLKSFRDGKVSSSSSPLSERGYAEALAYESPLGGGRIRFCDRFDIMRPKVVENK